MPPSGKDAPRRSTIENGVVNYTSASAINRFIDCPRSWYFRYVLGIPDPPGRAAILGTEAHARIEQYLSKGDDVLGQVERDALELGLIPKPDPGSGKQLVEARLEDGPLKLGSIPMAGGIDLVQIDGRPPELATITDWKFHSKSGYETPKPESLASLESSYGRQLLAYAEWLRLSLFSGPGLGSAEFKLRHVHFSFDRKAKPVAIPVSVALAQVEDSWHHLSETYEPQIKAAAKAEKAADVPFNLGHCKKYVNPVTGWGKPCVYINRCPEGQGTLRPFSRPLGGATVGMLDQIKMLNSQPPPPPVVFESPPAAPVPESNNAKGGAEETVSAALAPPAAPQIQDSVGGLSERLASPVEASLPAQESEPYEAQNKRRGRPKGSKNRAKTLVSAQVNGTEVVIAPAPSAGLSREYMETVDRRRLAEGKPQMFAEQIGVLSAPQTPSQEQQELELEIAAKFGPAPAPAAGEGLFLYYVGSPVGVVVKDLSQYAAMVQKQLLDAAGDGAFDVRVSEHPDLKFGKWRAHLTRFAANHPPEPGHYLVAKGDEVIEALAAGLASAAGPGRVVR